MQHRNSATYTVIIALAMMLFTTAATAANMVCAVDLNSNGDFTQPGETASCTAANGALCPIDAVACIATTNSSCPIAGGSVCSNGSCNLQSSCSLTSSIQPVSPPATCPIVGGSSCVGNSCSLQGSCINEYYFPGRGSRIRYTALCTATGQGFSAETLNRFQNPQDLSAQCNAQCKKVAACVTQPPPPPINTYTCPTNGLTSTNLNSCNASCNQTAACTQTTNYNCPTANGGACMDNGSGVQQCSPTSCIDLVTNPPVLQSNNSNMYTNNGTVAASGECLGQQMIFAGRSMECKTAGVDTAFRTCCKSFDMIVSDSTGSISQVSATVHAVKVTFDVAKAAYTTYKIAINAGRSATAISESVAMAKSVAITGFDPTSLAISIAISVAIDYFVNNCTQQDMETGSANASGRCYQTGTICKTKWSFGCVQKAKAYCCFNSKLGRIIHQQGRGQLVSFNNVAPSNCRGFYPEEFQNLDFSQMDLSSYYNDLKRSSSAVMNTQINSSVNQFYNQVK